MNITKSLYKKFNDIDYNFNLQPRHLLEHFDQNPNSIPDDKFLYFECCDDMESIDEMLKDIKKIHDKYNIDYNKIIFVTSIPILDWDNRPSLIDKINYYELESLITYSAFDENGSSSACHMFDFNESFPNDIKLCIKTVFENSKQFFRQKHYLTYNGYMKEHRVKLLGFLVEKDLLDKGLSSFFYYDEGQLSKEFINEYSYDEIEDKTVISKIRKLVPYSFDNYRHGFDDPDNASVAGFNITSPYKSIAYDVVDELDPLAKELRSVNCIKVKDSQLIGYNTDYHGFINMLFAKNISLDNKKILVLGYGSVARTIIFSLLNKHNCEIYIYGRDSKKIKNLINEIKKKYPHKIISLYNNKIKEDFLMINCLPLKICSKNVKSLLSYLSISNINICIDLNYVKSDFSLGINKHFEIISGIDMLIYQALKSFDIWFDNDYSKKINYLDLKKSIM